MTALLIKSKVIPKKYVNIICLQRYLGFLMCVKDLNRKVPEPTVSRFGNIAVKRVVEHKSGGCLSGTESSEEEAEEQGKIQ